MATRQRSTSRKKPLVLGFIGDGEVTESYLSGALDQLIGDRDDVTFIVPVTDESYNDSLAAVLDWADANKIEFQAVIDNSTVKDKELQQIADDAVKTVKSGDTGLQVTTLLDSSDIDGRLLVFWEADADGDGPDDASAALEAADSKDIPAFNVCESMKPFEFKDPGDDSAEPADDDNIPDPEPVRRRRGKAAEAADGDGDGDGDGGDGEQPAPLPSKAALGSLGVVALKNLAKVHLGSTAADLKGLTKEELIALLLDADDSDREAAQEAQGSLDLALGAQRGTPEPDSEAALLQAAVETALVMFTDALVARFLYEMNKPRSAGRPRKDGTAAQARPKPEADDTDAAPDADGDEGETRTRSRRRR